MILLALGAIIGTSAAAENWEIRQDIEGTGQIFSRVDSPSGGSVLQSDGGEATVGRIFKSGESQFVGLKSDSGRFKVWAQIGAQYGVSLTGEMFATATISQKYGNETFEGGKASVNATLGRYGTVDESLVVIEGLCHPRPTKILETEGKLGENDSMVIKTEVIWA